jgi:hypothetical protein
MDLTADDRNFLARKLFTDYLGRGPSASEQAFRAEQIRTQGLDLTFAALYDSQEAKNFRSRRGW